MQIRVVATFCLDLMALDCKTRWHVETMETEEVQKQKFYIVQDIKTIPSNSNYTQFSGYFGMRYTILRFSFVGLINLTLIWYFVFLEG